MGRGRLKLTSSRVLVQYIVIQGPFFSFFQKLEEAWTPLWGNSRAKAMRWLDASDDIFMYIYTIATRAMRRYILHTIAALNWIATSYAEDTTSLSCWLMLILFFCFRVWRRTTFKRTHLPNPLVNYHYCDENSFWAVFVLTVLLWHGKYREAA